MKKKLTQQEKKLYRRIDEVLHYLWDPIGIAGEPQARDEYHSYLPLVFRRVLENQPKEKITVFLAEIEESIMGSSQDKKKTLMIAELLLKTKETILNNGT